MTTSYKIMKIYIPTSTLNIDNILSTEAILPVSEYQKRDFGYQYYFELPELKSFGNQVVAFSEPPEFEIQDSHLENYPAIIELSFSESELKTLWCNSGQYHGIKIFSSSKRIPITPVNTRILFFNKKNRDYSIQSCSDSEKCKLLDFFIPVFELLENSPRCPLKELVSSIQLSELDRGSRELNENNFNRIKGFVWGFIIGYLMKFPETLANQIKIQKRIYDIVSSSKRDPMLSDSLHLELTNLDEEFFNYGKKFFKERWDHYIEIELPKKVPLNLSTEKLNDLLVHLGIEREAKNKYLLKWGLPEGSSLKDFRLNQKDTMTDYSASLQNLVDRAKNNIRIQNLDELSQEKSDFLCYRNGTTLKITSDEYHVKIFNDLTNQILWNDCSIDPDKLRTDKKNIARDIVVRLKSIFENNSEQWANSSYQSYFDKMRKNISSYTEFNLREINDIVVENIAAFILKGDDFDALLSFLENNAVKDFRYALALWGASQGYVSISRKIINNNVGNENLIKVYKSVQELLQQSVDVSLIKINRVDGPSFVENASKEGKTQKANSSCQPDLSNQQNFKEKGSRASDEDFLAYFNKVKGRRKNQNQLRNNLISALKIAKDQSNFIFLCILQSFDNWRPSNVKGKVSIWDQFQEKFCPDFEKIKSSAGSEQKEFDFSTPNKC